MYFANRKSLSHDQGFTLIESLIAIMVAGILAAIAVPNFFSWLNSRRVIDALTQVEGALREAQSEAIKKSQPCTVTVSPAMVTANNGCLTTGPRDLSKLGIRTLETNDTGITLSFSGANGDVMFSPKGTTPDDKVFVVYRTDGSGDQRCLVVSSGLGLLRLGEYTGASPANPVAADCTTPI